MLLSVEEEMVLQSENSAPRPLDVHAAFASRMAAAGIQPQDRIGKSIF